MRNHWLTKIWLILAALLISACSGSTEIEGIRNKESLKGSLVFWVSLPEGQLSESQINHIQKANIEIIDRFTQLYPDVHIVLKLKEDESIVEEFVQQVEKGLGPNLVYTRYSHLPTLIKRRVVLNLNQALDELEIAKLRSDALSQVRYQGHLYGLPLDLETQVLCYNKEKVKELPQTLSELRLQAQKGYSVGMQSSFTFTSWGIQAIGGQLLDAQGRVNLTRLQSWAKWMEWLKTAKNEPNLILNADFVALDKAFIEGRLAYLTCYSAMIPYLIEALGENRLGVASLPVRENYLAGPLLVTNALLFSSASSPAQTQLALRLGKFLINTEQQRRLISEFPGFIPVNKDVMIDQRLFPIQGILLKQSRTGIAISLDEREKMNVIVDRGNVLYSKVLAGEITPDAAAALITETIDTQFGSQ